MFLLTDKGVIAQATEDKIVLTDALNNTFTINISNSISKDLGRHNLFPCFLLKGEDMSKAKGVDPDQSSLLLRENYHDTFADWNEILLVKLRIIEWAAGQLSYGKPYSLEEIHLWRKFNQHEVEVRDCRCGALDYERFIAEWTKDNSSLTKAFQLHKELSRLCEVVRFEMAHAEARLRESIQWIQSLTLDLSKYQDYKNGCEYIKYGIKVDQVGWCITDTVKALSTALDGLSKYAFLSNNVNTNIFPKTSSVMAGHLSNYKPKGKYVATDDYERIQNLFIRIKPLINLRHELTHNQALYPIRQPAYVGYCTPCVNNLGIAYGEILWWDKDGDNYSRSCGRTGFFKQKLNAIVEAKESFLGAYELINVIIDSAFREIISRFEGNGLEEITYLEIGDDYTEKYKTCSLTAVITPFNGHATSAALP